MNGESAADGIILSLGRRGHSRLGKTLPGPASCCVNHDNLRQKCILPFPNVLAILESYWSSGLPFDTGEAPVWIVAHIPPPIPAWGEMFFSFVRFLIQFVPRNKPHAFHHFHLAPCVDGMCVMAFPPIGCGVGKITPRSPSMLAIVVAALINCVGRIFLRPVGIFLRSDACCVLTIGHGFSTLSHLAVHGEQDSHQSHSTLVVFLGFHSHPNRN